MLKRNIVQYNNDYLITRDEEGNYAILVLINNWKKSNSRAKVDIKLELVEGSYKIAVHKLMNTRLEEIRSSNPREREIIKRVTMPQCSFNIINDKEFTLSGEVGEQYLIEVNR